MAKRENDQYAFYLKQERVCDPFEPSNKKPAYENRKTKLTTAFKKTLKGALEFHLRTIVNR
jgi:hypothetical protein